MLTVHHLQVSQSDRIVWLCEELGIPYELVLYQRMPTGQAPEAYRALHPSQTAPVITDGPLVLAETAAIIEYLVAKHDDGVLAARYPDPDFTDYLFWFHFAAGSMMPRAMATMITRPDPRFIPRLDAAYAMVEQRLGEADYFAGDRFTAADIMMVFPLSTMRLYAKRDLAPYPNILRYLQRIGARPAYRRAMQKADPDRPLQLT